MDLFSYVLTFVEGILTFISPCILPMIPVYLFYLAGASDDMAESGSMKRSRLIINSIGFVAGFTIVFVLLGAVATSLGSFLSSNRDTLRKASGVVMIVFGLNFAGVLRIGLLNREKRFNLKFKRLGFFNSIVFGTVFGFGWSPCIGAFLTSALVLAGNSQTVFEGIMLLFIYSVGLGIPFIVASVIFDRIKSSLRYLQRYNKTISIISGIVLILAGVLIYIDFFKYLSVI